jgi:hypothetical protein
MLEHPPLGGGERRQVGFVAPPRMSGSRRKVPSPEHGASTITVSNRR